MNNIDRDNSPTKAKAFYFVALCFMISGIGCSHLDEPVSARKKPYFGHTANGSLSNSYVPKEVRRVEPWWKLF